MAFCGGCGAPRIAGDQFCPQCGRAYSTDATPAAPEPIPVDTPQTTAGSTTSWSGRERGTEPADEPFPSWATGAAVAAVLLAPFISLVVALVMRSSETQPRRRAFLKSWAIWSGAWLCTGFLIFVIAACSVMANTGALGGGCKGGPDPFGLPSYVSGADGKHWTAIVPCTGGGTKTRPATRSEIRFLNGP